MVETKLLYVFKEEGAKKIGLTKEGKKQFSLHNLKPVKNQISGTKNGESSYLISQKNYAQKEIVCAMR